jgi:hypothetical protein
MLFSKVLLQKQYFSIHVHIFLDPPNFEIRLTLLAAFHPVVFNLKTQWDLCQNTRGRIVAGLYAINK